MATTTKDAKTTKDTKSTTNTKGTTKAAAKPLVQDSPAPTKPAKVKAKGTTPADPHDWHHKIGHASTGCALCHERAGKLRHKLNADKKTFTVEYLDANGKTVEGIGQHGVKFRVPKA